MGRRSGGCCFDIPMCNTGTFAVLAKILQGHCHAGECVKDAKDSEDSHRQVHKTTTSHMWLHPRSSVSWKSICPCRWGHAGLTGAVTTDDRWFQDLVALWLCHLIWDFISLCLCWSDILFFS